MASGEAVAGAACTLPYPAKFHAARIFVDGLPEEVIDLKEEHLLLLYALKRQAVDGPCKDPKPWGWNGEESTKWHAWSSLGNMSGVEAMRLYVRTLEEEMPNWWALGGDSVDLDEDGMPTNGAAAAASAVAPQTDGDTPAAAAPAANGAAAEPPRPDARSQQPPLLQSAAQAAEEGRWCAPTTAGDRRPAPRYEHAVAVVNGRLYVCGGNSGGRYLSDTWALDLSTMTWSQAAAPPPAGKQPGSPSAEPLPPSSSGPPSGGARPPPPPPPPAGNPPTAGHTLIPWQGSLLSIGGHIKASGKGRREAELVVRVLHLPSMTWSALTPTGQAPPARGSHSATLVGQRVWVFGGEDSLRRPLGDLHVLDLATMEWGVPATSGRPPQPRSAHSAISYRDRWLLIFGGGSLVHCFQGLHVLDTHSGVWHTPATTGPTPSARAGHAGDLLGSTWYLAGGGNNTAGCADMVALHLSPLDSVAPAAPLQVAAVPAADEGEGGPAEDGGDGSGKGDTVAEAEALEPLELPALEWTHVVDVEPRSAIASEGLSMVSVPGADALLSFGGYNGKYHNSVHLYRPEGTSGTGRSAARTAAAAVQSVVAGAKAPLQALAEAVLPAAPAEQRPAANGYGRPQDSADAAAPPASQSLPSAALDSDAAAAEVAQLRAELEQAKSEAEAASSEVLDVKLKAESDLAALRNQLDQCQAALATAEQGAEEARAALAGEQSRAFQLEAQVAELRRALSRTSHTDRDLQRAQAALAEAEAKTASRGGFFNYIVGTPAS